MSNIISRVAIGKAIVKLLSLAKFEAYFAISCNFDLTNKFLSPCLFAAMGSGL